MVKQIIMPSIRELLTEHDNLKMRRLNERGRVDVALKTGVLETYLVEAIIWECILLNFDLYSVLMFERNYGYIGPFPMQEDQDFLA